MLIKNFEQGSENSLVKVSNSFIGLERCTVKNFKNNFLQGTFALIHLADSVIRDAIGEGDGFSGGIGV
eukprot:CAMPEP_0170549472 /NCGR_PEP_ID=MMETSP0211-20121228/7632_1 /TAXON_ID=311385 /ORGANISM="Pseudokeronopsis sp., Strain OXSARD2" /LENGTH=67 /DNA_ID=CAMNT_0010855513 /DNA_START=17 /DNA_END=220 /DNA_ORIENTATION=-